MLDDDDGDILKLNESRLLGLKNSDNTIIAGVVNNSFKFIIAKHLTSNVTSLVTDSRDEPDFETVRLKRLLMRAPGMEVPYASARR